MATAMSLAERMIRAFSASLSGRSAPTLRPEPRRRLLARIRRDEDLGVLARLVIADRLEGEVGGHHLGERGGIPGRVGILGIEDVPVVVSNTSAAPAAAGAVPKAPKPAPRQDEFCNFQPKGASLAVRD